MDDQVSFAIPDSARMRHVYIAGKSQYGKSTLIHWMALQDIDQEKGVCIIDPHGDLVNKLIHYIPEHCVEKTIYFDATAPIPLDFFSAETDREKDILADDILMTFRRLSDSWGVRMDSILSHAIATLLSIPGSTFLDIYHIISDENYRQRILRQCSNEKLKHYWLSDEFLKERSDSKLAITSRMSKFILNPALSAIVGNPSPKLKISELMKNKGVLLVNLANVGQDTGDLLGSLIVSKIQQAAMRRKKEERVPFYLYVDEFQHFQTSAFDTILSEAGKYQLGLTMAHQYLDQLDAGIKSSVLGNVSSFILFRLNEKDAIQFKGTLRKEHEALAHLGQGRAIYHAFDGTIHHIKTPTPPPYSAKSYAEIIRKRTIDLYSCALPKDVLGSKDEDISGSPRRLTRHVKRPPPTDPAASR